MTLKPLKDLNTVCVWINKYTILMIIIEFFAYTISDLNINLLSNTPNVVQTLKFVFNTYTNVYTPDFLIASMLAAIILTLGGWYWSKSTENIFFRTGIGIIVKGIPYYFVFKGFTYYVALFLLTGMQIIFIISSHDGC